jgi:glycosyltransferase involved in cell wall biosynthesis
VVLRAAPKVLAVAPRARFVFVGRDVGDPAAPPSSTWLRTEAERLGVAHAVELRGWLDWGGVADELRRASVCVFPSRWECFPNVAAEAAAIGRPVVVSSAPAFRELMEDNVTGRVASSEDAGDWATAITDLLLNPERARAFGEAGSALIRRVSDPARLVDLALAAYEHAVERWRNGQRVGRRVIPEIG